MTGKLHGFKMADIDEIGIDDDEFIKIFEDSDDENEFEGFGPGPHFTKDRKS